MIEDIRSPAELLALEERWRGESYSAIHFWLRKQEKTGTCEFCEAERPTQWALIAERYSRDLRDYAELCQPCHSKFDHGTL